MRSNGFPPTSSSLSLEDKLENATTYQWQREVSAEVKIQNNYWEFPSAFFVPIASTSMFGFEKRDSPILEWAKFVAQRNYTIVDGGLYVIPELLNMSTLSSSLDYVLTTLNEDTLEILKKVVEGGPAAIWEFKNLTAADRVVVKEIESIGRGESGTFAP